MAEASIGLLDVLAIAIAFSVVMLLLSVVVLALAQATQAALRLRARNLQRGLQAILENELKWPTGKARPHAAALLNTREIAKLRRRDDPNSAASRIRGPIVSWLEPETLRAALGEIRQGQEPAKAEGGATKTKTTIRGDGDGPGSGIGGPLAAINVDSAVDQFAKLDKYMSKRFGVAMRVVSLVWACIVAFSFQVSTPALLKHLSTDAEYRARVADLAPTVVQSSAESLSRLSDHSDASRTALDLLARRHSDLRSQIERVTSDTNFPEGVSEELSSVLEDVPARAEIVEEFEALLLAELEKGQETALREARTAVDQLSLFDLTPWRYGGAFYWADNSLQFVNLLGVLTSIILLSLGAPFWFNTLKSALTLRDTLAPNRDRKQPNDGQDNPPKSEQ